MMMICAPVHRLSVREWLSVSGPCAAPSRGRASLAVPRCDRARAGTDSRPGARPRRKRNGLPEFNFTTTAVDALLNDNE